MFDWLYRMPFFWHARERIGEVRADPPEDLVKAIEEAERFPGCLRPYKEACDMALREIKRHTKSIPLVTERSIVLYTGKNPRSNYDFVFGIERKIDPKFLSRLGVVYDNISFHFPRDREINGQKFNEICISRFLDLDSMEEDEDVKDLSWKISGVEYCTRDRCLEYYDFV